MRNAVRAGKKEMKGTFSEMLLGSSDYRTFRRGQLTGYRPVPNSGHYYLEENGKLYRCKLDESIRKKISYCWKHDKNFKLHCSQMMAITGFIYVATAIEVEGESIVTEYAMVGRPILQTMLSVMLTLVFAWISFMLVSLLPMIWYVDDSTTIAVHLTLIAIFIARLWTLYSSYNRTPTRYGYLNVN